MDKKTKTSLKTTPLEKALDAVETMDNHGHWVLVPTIPSDTMLQNAHRLTGIPVETIHRLYNLMIKEE